MVQWLGSEQRGHVTVEAGLAGPAWSGADQPLADMVHRSLAWNTPGICCWDALGDLDHLEARSDLNESPRVRPLASRVLFGVMCPA